MHERVPVFQMALVSLIMAIMTISISISISIIRMNDRVKAWAAIVTTTGPG